jgi:membrane fusion protein (multidrug efflux system)
LYELPIWSPYQFSLLPPDNATGNFVKITQRFPVRIKLTDNENSLEELRAGMNAEVSIPK